MAEDGKIDLQKQAWQAQQAQLDRDEEQLKRDKERKAKAALRKIERLRKELDLLDDTTDWEAEFTDSITDRLDQYGSAFADPSKGGYGEALSYAQKVVINNMRAKARRLKREKRGAGAPEKKTPEKSKQYSSFKRKTPKPSQQRVKQLDETFEEEAPAPPPKGHFSPKIIPGGKASTYNE